MINLIASCENKIIGSIVDNLALIRMQLELPILMPFLFLRVNKIQVVKKIINQYYLWKARLIVSIIDLHFIKFVFFGKIDVNVLKFFWTPKIFNLWIEVGHYAISNLLFQVFISYLTLPFLFLVYPTNFLELLRVGLISLPFITFSFIMEF